MAKADVKIDKSRCKGCEICVKLCPAEALAIKNFKAAFKNPEKCTGCMACELRCPDFAVTVVKIK